MKLIRIKITCEEIETIYINPKYIRDVYKHGERYKMTVAASPEDSVYEITEQCYNELLEEWSY